MEITPIDRPADVVEETSESISDYTGIVDTPAVEESGDIGDGYSEDLPDLVEDDQEEEVEAVPEESEAVAPPSSTTEPIAVYLVEEPEVEAYAVSGAVYPGTISTTYLDYFEGIADKLSYKEHYVIFRESQYVYRMMWGDTLSLTDFRFSGNNLLYCSLYVSNYNSDFNVVFGSDSLSLDASGGFVYSDLGDFPSITRGGTGIEALAVLFAIGFAVVYSVCHDIFDYVMEHVYRK